MRNGGRNIFLFNIEKDNSVLGHPSSLIQRIRNGYNKFNKPKKGNSEEDLR